MVLSKCADRLYDRELACISREEILDFLLTLTKDNKHVSKRKRYSVLSSLYNSSNNKGLPSLANLLNTTVIKNIFKRLPSIQWQIVDQETIDEIIFRTTGKRNRLMLEIMDKGGMQIGEVLKFTTEDVQECSLVIQGPKSGRKSERDYVPREISGKLSQYVKANDINSNDGGFPVSYVASGQWSRMLGSLLVK